MNMSGWSIYRALILVGLLALAPLSAGATEADQAPGEPLQLNLPEAVALGLERNPVIQAMQFAVERSRSDVKSVRGRLLPRLSAGYSQTHLDSIDAVGPSDDDYINQIQESWRVSLQQPLYAGKTLVNSYQKAKIQEAAMRLEKEAEERKLIRQIQEAFLQLLKAREDRRSLEQTVARLQVALEAAEAFASRQMAPYVEVLQARVELEDAQQQLSQAKNEEVIFKISLDRLLAFEDGAAVVYVGTLGDIDLRRAFALDRCFQTAKAQRIELKRIEANMELSEKEKQIATGQALPRVTLQLNLSDYNRDYDQLGANAFGQKFDRDQENQYWTAGVSVEWSFFNGGEYYYRRQSMKNEIKRLERLYADTAASIETEVQSAFLRLQEARLRVDATRLSVQTAEEAYRMEKKRLEMRVGTIQALINAQDALTRAEANRNKAMRDYQLALADLYFAMGTRSYALN
jgi:outer membrane protein TolC